MLQLTNSSEHSNPLRRRMYRLFFPFLLYQGSGRLYLDDLTVEGLLHQQARLQVRRVIVRAPIDLTAHLLLLHIKPDDAPSLVLYSEVHSLLLFGWLRSVLVVAHVDACLRRRLLLLDVLRDMVLIATHHVILLVVREEAVVLS